MQHDEIVFSIFLIFTGAAVAATLALAARQSMLVAYIALGSLVGPWGMGLVRDPATIEGIGHIGIIFLLFLLGLNLHPQKLFRLLKEATFVTVASSLAFAAIGLVVGLAFGMATVDAFVVAGVSMFSSTIIGLKLLPTTALHHRHVGEVIISVLLLQDIIAIVLLLALEAAGRQPAAFEQILAIVAGLPALLVIAVVLERWVLIRLIRRFDTIQEYVFLTAIGWCLGIAELGRAFGLSYEIGAFIAGVSLAQSVIATFIAESLKPLRDFFLVMFFFSLGAGFELPVLPDVAAPALALAAALLVAKPFIFRWLLVAQGETDRLSREIGARLGQISEFSLLIAVIAASGGLIAERTGFIIQAATIISFVVSSYYIMMRYPTPIAVTAALRRD